MVTDAPACDFAAHGESYWPTSRPPQDAVAHAIDRQHPSLAPQHDVTAIADLLDA
jgi:hypothetical protein